MTDKNDVQVIHLKKDQVLTLEGDDNNDLFYVSQGRFMVCVRKSSAVTPLAYIEKGEFIGELSFFDGLPRSADIIAAEESAVVRISTEQIKQEFPSWLVLCAEYMTKKIRLLDDVIRQKGIKKKNTQTIQALSIEEQRRIMDIIKKHQAS